jgi:pyruvate/2-oxoglutarate dehydrogenase complex dihydrolipoamide acyltransferase (E2) component
MARVEFRLPQYGMGMSDAEIVSWSHRVGDAVQEGEILLTIDTAKASQDIEAPTAGVLREIHVAVGDVAFVGDLIAVIETE